MASLEALSSDGHRTAIFSLITPAETAKIPYATQKTKLNQGLRRHSWFRKGEFLDTMEKGVMYPVVHLLELQSSLDKQKFQPLESQCLGTEFTLQQGCYSEIKQFLPNGKKYCEDASKESTAYILLGFKVLDSTFRDVLEDNWKDWSGARLIYLNLADEFGLYRFSFYKRIAPAADYDLFMYILLVECKTVTTKNTIKLLDFVQRLRVERMIGYLSVYRHGDGFGGETNGEAKQDNLDLWQIEHIITLVRDMDTTKTNGDMLPVNGAKPAQVPNSSSFPDTVDDLDSLIEMLNGEKTETVKKPVRRKLW